MRSIGVSARSRIAGVAAAAEEAVDEEERELVAEVDDAVLAAASSLDVEDERGAGRRERQRELAERELLDALKAQLDPAAHAADQPALERLHEALVHRLERAERSFETRCGRRKS